MDREYSEIRKEGLEKGKQLQIEERLVKYLLQ
jgi:hypothetical protein